MAALESCADAVLVEAGVSVVVRELGRMRTVAPDGDGVPGRDIVFLDIQSKGDEQKAAALPRETSLLLRMKDWTIILLENLLAQRDRIMAEVRTVAEARTMLGILEKGVDGVVTITRDVQDVRRIVDVWRRKWIWRRPR